MVTFYFSADTLEQAIRDKKKAFPNLKTLNLQSKALIGIIKPTKSKIVILLSLRYLDL